MDKEAYYRHQLENFFTTPGIVAPLRSIIYNPPTGPCPVLGDSRLELFDIQIDKNKSEKPLSEIWIDNIKGKETVYLAPNIPIGESLPLIGPSKPCMISYYGINMYFGDRSWVFGVHYTPRYPPCPHLPPRNPLVWLSEDSQLPVEWDTPTTKVAVSEIGSEATIRFEPIRRAAIARLEFQFFKKEKAEIEITDGVISATHNQNEDTKRVIRQFGAKNTHLSEKRKVNDNLLDFTKQAISLDRSVLAVPINGELNVSVEMTYDVKGNSTVERKIKSTVNFKVPLAIEDKGAFEEQYFPNFDDQGVEFPKLRLIIFWDDPCWDNYDEPL